MLETLIADLEALKAGGLSESGFRARHPHRPDSSQIEAVLCNLEHYLADADIRARDPEYARFQNAEFQKLLVHLRAGALDQAEKVTFLHAS